MVHSLTFDFFRLLSPANLSLMAAKAKNMTALEKALALITGVFWVIYGIGMVALWFNQKIFGTVLYLMRGLGKQEVKKEKAGRGWPNLLPAE